MSPLEKNSREAFIRSFSSGFGAETDVRDYRGDLVISHDIPSGNELTLDELLQLAVTHKNESSLASLTLALNIKSDGLAGKMRAALAGFSTLEVFVFDMSVPDMRSYLGTEIPVFTRMSEVERDAVWIDCASGIWLDSFESNWFDVATVQALLARNKDVCIVSPELHGREHQSLWNKIKPIAEEPRLMICTDIPVAANLFFGC